MKPGLAQSPFAIGICPNFLAYHRVEAAFLPPDVRLVRHPWLTYKPARRVRQNFGTHLLQGEGMPICAELGKIHRGLEVCRSPIDRNSCVFLCFGYYAEREAA